MTTLRHKIEFALWIRKKLGPKTYGFIAYFAWAPLSVVGVVCLYLVVDLIFGK